jgi:universal stress protein E
VAKPSRWQTLMVALGTTDSSARPLLRKAVKLADRFGMSVQLLHVLPPDFAPAPDALEQASNQLRDLVTHRQRRTFDFDTIVVRDYPIADAIVREVLKHKPDLLLASSHRHGKLTRVLMDQTDWELIRNCPCPLWLSKSDRVPPKLKVLAAVDPFHSRSKPTRLVSASAAHRFTLSPKGPISQRLAH